MVMYIPPPAPRDLLPPLLACLPTAFLPTAFASGRPPPALLPLLSPILRQRVQLLSSESWLPLLCWDAHAASKLPGIIENIQLEPHPVSGEVELRDVETIQYRRLDPETLHARLVLDEFNLLAIYLWCTGEEGNAWRLAELRGIDDRKDGTQWFDSMSEANDDTRPGFNQKTLSQTNDAATGANHAAAPPAQAKEEEDDDDAYWASYDRTPSRTPHKRSPAPITNSSVQLPTQSELEYFARYAAEVQPALDAHDPEEEGPPPGESTLNGDELERGFQQRHREPEMEPLETSNLGPHGYDSSLPPPAAAFANGLNGLNGLRMDSLSDEKAREAEQEQLERERYSALSHPRPSSSASSNSVERLEREAESHSQAEMAIKQHISTDIKSLFRLARSAGIAREEFERIIQRELEVLPMLELDQ